MKPERLTYKNDRFVGGYNSVENDDFACVGKLGQYEDIEDELGIDLLKLLTAKTIYFMHFDYVKDERHPEESLVLKEADQERYGFLININDKSLKLCDLDFGGRLYLDFGGRLYLDFGDYGKKDKYGGWAFTKEELE